MAYLLDRRGTIIGQCSGTVVAPDLVLTAGHCAEDPQSGVLNDPTGYLVMTGNVNVGAAPAERQVSTVSRVIVCGCYDRHTAIGDVALLELSTPTSAPAITLASPMAGRAGAVIAGWGKTSAAQQTPVEQLQWANTSTLPAGLCERGVPFFRASSEICTISSTGTTGVCNGDSGGPVLEPMASAIGGMVQIGVASHVYGNCSTALPSVFTRVDVVAAWVREWAQALAPGESQATAEPVSPTLDGIASARSLKVSRAGVSLVVGCDSDGGECSGNVKVAIAVRSRLVRRLSGQTIRSRAVTREVTLANDRFAIAPGASVTIRSELSPENQALLARLGGQGFDTLIFGSGTAPRVARVTYRG